MTTVVRQSDTYRLVILQFNIYVKQKYIPTRYVATTCDVMLRFDAHNSDE